jgi:hypothetical protein
MKDEQRPASAERTMSTPQRAGEQWWRSHPWYGGHLLAANREKFPAEEILKYNRRYVAWYPDGSGIFDSDTARIALEERIRAAGDEPAMYPIEYITDESFISEWAAWVQLWEGGPCE